MDVGTRPLAVCKQTSTRQLLRHKSGASASDSVNSLHGRKFARWAEIESKEQGLAMDQFLLAALASSTAAGSPASSSGSEGSLQSQAPSSPRSSQVQQVPRMATTPYRPHDAYQLGCPQPACGPERMATTTALNELRVTTDAEVESVLRLLCNVFEVETAGVTLLTGECVWAPYTCGIMSTGLRPARWGFCGWSFMNANHELLVVEDSSKDARLSANLFVVDAAFSLMFYVAAPLISSNGHRLGTLCIFGQQPRKFDATRGQLLANMAELLVRQFERNWAMRLQEHQEGTQLRRSLAVYDSACLVVDMSKPLWSILHMNPPAIMQLGVDLEPSTEYLAHYPQGKMTRKPWHGVPFDSLFECHDKSPEWTSGSFEFVLRGVRGAASAPQLCNKLFDLHFRIAISDGLDQEQPFCVGLPPWLPMASDNFGSNYFFVRVEEALIPAGRGMPSPAQSLSTSTSATSQLLGSVIKEEQSLSGQRLGSSSSSASGSSSGRRPLSTGGSRDTDGGGAVSSSSLTLVRGPMGAISSPIEGLVLGPLVGKGSYGRVYRGIYRGAPVAVKIISDIKSMRLDRRGQPLEAALTGGMGHMGVLRTLTWAFSQASNKARRSSTGGNVIISSSGSNSRRNSEGGVASSKHEGYLVSSSHMNALTRLGRAAGGTRSEAGVTGDSDDASRVPPAARSRSEGGAAAGSTHGKAPASHRARSEGGGGAESDGGSSSGIRERGVAEIFCGGGATSTNCWMVMEYCDMGCIADAVLKGWFRTSRNPTEGGTNLRTVAVTAYEIASAMQYLHSHDVVHGDLCGGNVMLKSSDVYKHGFVARVGDFGLAREASAGPRTTKRNMYGTVTHMPPEALMDGGITKATDVYSFGVLLWEMLTGSWAWAGLRHTQVVCQVALLKRSLAIPPGLPHALEQLLSSCLAPSPASRPMFDEIVDVLNEWLQTTWRADQDAMTLRLPSHAAPAATP